MSRGPNKDKEDDEESVGEIGRGGGEVCYTAILLYCPLLPNCLWYNGESPRPESVKG